MQVEEDGTKLIAAFGKSIARYRVAGVFIGQRDHKPGASQDGGQIFASLRISRLLLSTHANQTAIKGSIQPETHKTLAEKKE